MFHVADPSYGLLKSQIWMLVEAWFCQIWSHIIQYDSNCIVGTTKE